MGLGGDPSHCGKLVILTTDSGFFTNGNQAGVCTRVAVCALRLHMYVCIYIHM